MRPDIPPSRPYKLIHIHSSITDRAPVGDRETMLLGSRLLTSARFALVCTVATVVHAQGTELTVADYTAAEKMMAYNLNPLVDHTVAAPAWLPDGRFWYRDTVAGTSTYMLVDPAKKQQVPAFDAARLAPALTAALVSKPALDPKHLPVSDFTLADADKTLLATVSGRRVRCDLAASTCKTLDAPNQPAGQAPPRGRRAPLSLSPDKTKEAFIRDWNLWVRDLNTGKETQLTKDGVKDFGYATDNAGWKHTDAAIVRWSPDSKKIATFQQDQRQTGEMYLVPVTNTHPKLEAWKYPPRRRQRGDDDPARHPQR